MIDLTGLTIAELCDLLHQVTEEIARRWEESRVPKEDKYHFKDEPRREACLCFG